MAQWVKGLAANLDSLLILRTTWRKERADSGTLSSDLHRCVCCDTHIHTINRYINVKIKIHAFEKLWGKSGKS